TSPALSRLDVLAAGNAREKYDEALLSPELRALIAAARETYDLILLDSPAVLAGGQALAVAAHADAALLALRIRLRGRKDALRTRDLLTRLGVTLLGVVITGADDKSATGY